jgi:hypothetical protein
MVLRWLSTMWRIRAGLSTSDDKTLALPGKQNDLVALAHRRRGTEAATEQLRHCSGDPLSKKTSASVDPRAYLARLHRPLRIQKRSPLTIEDDS